MATVVEGNPKAHFHWLQHRYVREDATPFPGLFYFTLDPYLIILSVMQGTIKYHFLSLWYNSTWDLRNRNQYFADTHIVTHTGT